MTVHWIDSDTLKRKGAAIACRRFKGSHTYDKVAEIISEIHSEFDLKLYKIVKTIIDNGSNMIKAFKMFGKSESIVLLSEQINEVIITIQPIMIMTKKMKLMKKTIYFHKYFQNRSIKI